MKEPAESTSRDIRRAVNPRRRDSHKGDNGVVLVVGGSWLYHGAPVLSALAALRTGADLVFVAVPRQIVASVRAQSPNIIAYPMPDAKLTIGSAHKLLRWLPSVDSAVVGPGMGRQKTSGMTHLVTELSKRNVKMVLDADALVSDVVSAAAGKEVVITPHAGEFQRLFNIKLDMGSLRKRAQEVSKMAAEAKVVILLKGQVDIVSDGKRTVVNRTGSPAMTVGGTGDVLSGVVATLMARGATPLDAAVAGARVNGLSGELAEKDLGTHILATDVIDRLPLTLKNFDRLSG